jgi:hypothetical protein
MALQDISDAEFGAMNIKIQRSQSGAVMGALLWIPAKVIEPLIEPGQEMIEASIEGPVIRLGEREP